MLKPWKVLRRRIVYAAPPYLEVAREDIKLPDGRVVEGYHQLATGTFASIVPETADGGFVLLRQYRHGIRRIGYALPGGRVEPGETPLAAARRELKEETGLEADDWHAIGDYDISCTYGFARNLCFHARGVRRVAKIRSDDLEASEIVTLTRSDALAALHGGAMASLGHVAPLALVLLKDLSPPPSRS